MGYIPIMGFSSWTFKLVFLAIYLISSYAIFKLALLRSMPYAWMAFIPIFSLYMFGSIGDGLKYMDARIDNLIGNVPLAYALPIISMVSSFFGGPIGSLVGLLLQVANLVVYYLIFSYYAYNNKIIFTILSIIPVVGPLLILYSLRNHKL